MKRVMREWTSPRIARFIYDVPVHMLYTCGARQPHQAMSLEIAKVT